MLCLNCLFPPVCQSRLGKRGLWLFHLHSGTWAASHHTVPIPVSPQSHASLLPPPKKTEQGYCAFHDLEPTSLSWCKHQAEVGCEPLDEMDLKGQAGHGVAPTSCMAVREKPLGKIIEKFQMKYKSVMTFRILKNLHFFFKPH